MNSRVGSLSLLPGATPASRLCCAFSRRTGSAVERNRGRRRLQEAFRGLAPRLVGSWDLVFRARRAAVESELSQMAAELAQMCRAAGSLE